MANRFRRFLFKALEYITAASIAVVLVFWVANYLRNQETNYDSTQCAMNVEYLSLALMAYSEKNGVLPPGNFVNDGKPPLNWRVAVQPFKTFTFDCRIEDRYRFDEPWDSLENSKLHAFKSHEFHCYLDSSPETDTSYLTVQGPSTFFPDQGAVKLSDHQDGLANSILVVETHHSGIHWMEPRDLRIEEAVKGLNRPENLSISSNHKYFNNRKQDGAFVTFADRRIQFLNSNIDPKVLRSLLEIDNPDKPKEQFVSP